MVDAGDLKSPGRIDCTGSSPVCSISKQIIKSRIFKGMRLFSLTYLLYRDFFMCTVLCTSMCTIKLNSPPVFIIQRMKRTFIIYAILMPVCYLLLLWGGNTCVTNMFAQLEWNEQAAPWLGEAPEGMYTIQITDVPEPYTAFYIPYSEEMEQRFHKAFPVDLKNNPTGTIIPKTLPKVLHPAMMRIPGSMLRLVIVNPNAEIDKARAQGCEVMYPIYLERNTHHYDWIILALSTFSIVFPSLFCCVGWLWIQGKAILSVETCAICLLIPLVCVAGADFISFLLFGQYDGIVTIIGSVLMLFCTTVISTALICLTALARFLTLVAKKQ